MKPNDQFTIYEFLNQNGDPAQFMCDGHVDSMMFRDKCFQDYYVKPMIIRHQWQKTSRMSERRAGRNYQRAVTKTVYYAREETGATPVTIGLV